MVRASVVGWACLGLGLSLGLTGCGAMSVGSSAAGSASGTTGAVRSGVALSGTVHGGQQPIAGAHVYLLAAASGASGAGQAAYGGAGIAASATNQSQSLLTSAGNTTLDSSGGATNGWYYVTTDASGNFSISGDYTCTAGQQVYLYSLGGNAGSGANASAGLLAALGSCPSGGNFLSGSTPVTYVVINEVSTVAAAYAMAGFATDATHVGSSGTALALTGIANAFAAVNNLENLSTGAALFSNPAGGLSDLYTLNTLADIIAACVNSNGAVTGGTAPTACYTVFTNALSSGATGTQPTDTATAMLNIAHNPSTTNPSGLFALVGSSPPFLPDLQFAPDSFILTIDFSAVAFSNTGLAIDGSGNVWMTSNPGLGTGLVVLSNSGANLSTPGNYGGGTGGLASPANPTAIAIDQAGNAWITNSHDNNVIELSNSGVVLSGASGYTGGGLNNPLRIAIDSSGNAWVTNVNGNSVTEISSSGSILSGASGYTSGGLDEPVGIAIDGTGNVWIANYGGSSLVELSSAGVPLSGANGFTSSNLQWPTGVAITASGSVWVLSDTSSPAPYSGLVEFSSTGSELLSGPWTTLTGIALDGGGDLWLTAQNQYYGTTFGEGPGLSPSLGSAFNYGGVAVAVDGSGNVWEVPESGGLEEMVGAGVPVVTPLSVAVQNNALASRP